MFLSFSFSDAEFRNVFISSIKTTDGCRKYLEPRLKFIEILQNSEHSKGTNDIEKMSLNGVLCEDNLTNLDEGSAFPDEFKKSVLSFHMKKHTRELNEREIERIVSTETYYGFPFECSLFCSISMTVMIILTLFLKSIVFSE
jgi:hypothetical protein